MIKKILVPLDGSKLAEGALAYAESLAQKFDAKLMLAEVIQPVEMPPLIYDERYDYRPFYARPVLQDNSDDNIAQHYLLDVQRTLDYPAHIAVLEGYPVADVIVDFARQEAVDLIVMSTHGRSGVGRWVFGSVANKILQHAPCPVFLVRANQTSQQNGHIQHSHANEHIT